MNFVPDDLKEEFRAMFQAATDASFICKKLGDRISSLNVMTKSDDSPVTRKQINIFSFHPINCGSC